MFAGGISKIYFSSLLNRLSPSMQGGSIVARDMQKGYVQ
jgi:hypothetical protein